MNQEQTERLMAENERLLEALKELVTIEDLKMEAGIFSINREIVAWDDARLLISGAPK